VVVVVVDAAAAVNAVVNDALKVMMDAAVYY
jgi:hypothetical protein